MAGFVHEPIRVAVVPDDAGRPEAFVGDEPLGLGENAGIFRREFRRGLAVRKSDGLFEWQLHAPLGACAAVAMLDLEECSRRDRAIFCSVEAEA